MLWGHRVRSSNCKSFLKTFLRTWHWRLEGWMGIWRCRRKRKFQAEDKANREEHQWVLWESDAEAELGVHCPRSLWLLSLGAAPFPPNMSHSVVSGLSSNVRHPQRGFPDYFSRIITAGYLPFCPLFFLSTSTTCLFVHCLSPQLQCKLTEGRTLSVFSWWHHQSLK